MANPPTTPHPFKLANIPPLQPTPGTGGQPLSPLARSPSLTGGASPVRFDDDDQTGGFFPTTSASGNERPEAGGGGAGTFFTGPMASSNSWPTLSSEFLTLEGMITHARQDIIAGTIDGLTAAVEKLAARQMGGKEYTTAGEVDVAGQQLMEDLMTPRLPLIKSELLKFAATMKSDGEGALTANPGDRMNMQAAMFKAQLIQAAPVDEVVEGQTEPSVKSVARLFGPMSLTISRRLYRTALALFLPPATRSSGQSKASKTGKGGAAGGGDDGDDDDAAGADDRDDEATLQELEENAWASVLRDQYVAYCSSVIEKQPPVGTKKLQARGFGKNVIKNLTVENLDPEDDEDDEPHPVIGLIQALSKDGLETLWKNLVGEHGDPVDRGASTAQGSKPKAKSKATTKSKQTKGSKAPAPAATVVAGDKRTRDDGEGEDEEEDDDDVPHPQPKKSKK